MWVNIIMCRLHYTSHRSRRAVKPTSAAENIAHEEAIEEGKTIATALATLYSYSIPVWIALDSKDLFSTISL